MGKFYRKKSKTININKAIQSTSENNLIIDESINIEEEVLDLKEKKTIGSIIKTKSPDNLIIKKGVTIKKSSGETILNNSRFKKTYDGYNSHKNDYVFSINDLTVDFIKFSGFNEKFSGFLNDKSIYLKVYNEVKDLEYDTKIPKIVHLCYGFKKDPEFEFFNYLSILSIVNKIKPDKIILYHHYDIKGKWWDRAKIYLTTIKTNLVHTIFDKNISHFAHMSDIIRLEMLRFCGGIYLDIDTFVNKSFDDLLNNNFVIGVQDSGGKGGRDYYGLCNATMLSEKDSFFSKKWLESYKDFNQLQWDYHSVIKPYYLAKSYEDKVTIMKPKLFFPFLWGETNQYLLSDNEIARFELKNCYSMHLWETNEKETLSKIDYNSVFNEKNNLYYIFKDYLLDNRKATVSLIFLTHNRPEKTIDYIDTYIKVLDREDIKELIIYDNASTDRVLLYYLNKISKLDKVKVIYGDENIGVAGGRDILFKNVTGDVVFSLDSDSKLKDQTFIDDAKEILNDKSIWICGTVGAFFNGWVHGTHVDVNDDNPYEGEVDTLAGCCQIFRSEVLEKIWVDLAFQPFWYEDTDFCFQAKVLGGKIYRFHFNNKFYHVWGGSGNIIFGNKLFEEKHKIMLKKWANNKDLKLNYMK